VEHEEHAMHDWVSLVRARVAALGGPADTVLIEEFAAHLEQEYDQARADGHDDEAAYRRAEALLEASHPLVDALHASQPRSARRLSEWSRQEPLPPDTRGGLLSRLGFARDARYAARVLLRAPAFSAVAILTFAVGIGVNAAVFSVVNAVLLQPLPYPDADRITLVWLDNRRQGISEDITSYPNYRHWREGNTAYQHLAAFTSQSFTLTGPDEPERLIGAAVTSNFFDVMGLQPTLGRVFTEANEGEGQDAVVVLSHGLWQRRFGGTPDAIGRTLTLGGRPHEVVGVMPQDMTWPEQAELWKPLAPDQQLREARGSFWLPVIGRLKPGVSVEQAQAEMSALSAQLEQSYESMRGFGANVVTLQRQLVGDVAQGLLVLLVSVGFVLLIACANLANLMFGRTAARQKEFAVRSALGAGRAVLVRQIVTETLVLAVLGALVGVLLAYWATGFFVALGGDSIPRAQTIGIDGRVLGFALMLATLAAILSGVIPAWHASRAASAEHLREGVRQGAGTASHHTRSVLVGAEVALAFVLLTGAGLLIQTLWNMQTKDRGFAPERIATMRISAPATMYSRADDVRAFYGQLLERVRAIPGVESAATGTAVLQPLVTNAMIFAIEGRPLPPPEERIEYPFEVVSPGYFETLGVSLVQGRTFTDHDREGAPEVVVVNETLARTVWPDQDPLGRRLRAGGDDAPWLTVVGVIRDMHRTEVTRAVRPEVYLSTLQSTPRTQMLLVKTTGKASAIVPEVRREVRAINPQLPLFAVSTLDDALAESHSQPIFQATLLAGFAGIALLLAAIGIYGVTSHAVSQRTQEMGIRMALGAARRDVLRMMLLQHLRPAVFGVAAGIAGALLLSQSLRALLYGVAATDPWTFAAMAVVLLAVAAAACWLPARRATRVDPLIAVRSE
jgi:putative ABC transport system permease protein